MTTVRLMRLFSRERVDLVFANDFNELPATLAGRFLGLPRVMRLRFVFRLPYLDSSRVHDFAGMGCE